MTRRVLPGLLVAASLAVALAGCGSSPEPQETVSATPPESATTTPPAEPTPDPVVLPTSCDQLGTAATRAATVDTLTLQGDGVGFVRPAPPSAQLVLGCDWFAGDATGILILISTVPDDDTVAYAESTLPADGWTCTVGDTGNYICSKVTPNSQYPVDTTEVVIARDDVWIYESYSNIDGDLLLADITASLWGTGGN